MEQYGLPSDSELNSVLKKLWSMDEREYHHFGVLLLQKLTKKFIKDQIILFEYLIVNKSWWDTVDGLSSWIIGEYFKLYPEQIKPVTGRWINSNNFWLQRVALLFQKYKEKTNESLLYSYILIVSDSKEFFIQKAIGWILREYSKTNPASVKNFITNNKLAALSVREGSKYI